MSKTGIKSLVGQLRASLGRAEGGVRRTEHELTEARAAFDTALAKDRGWTYQRFQRTQLEANDAAAYLANIRKRLAAEEARLLQPGAFLRYE